MRQKCRYSEKISAYMDHELPATEMNEIELHMANCHDCRIRLSRYQMASDLLLDMPETTPSSEFDVHFQEKLAATGTSATSEKTPSGCVRHWIYMGRRITSMLFLFWRPYVIGAAAMTILAVFIFKNMNGTLSPEELVMTEDLEILQEYEILSDLDLFEYWDILENGIPES